MKKLFLVVVVIVALGGIALAALGYSQMDREILAHPTEPNAQIDLRSITAQDLELIKSRFNVKNTSNAAVSTAQAQSSSCNTGQSICYFFLALGCGDAPNINSCQCGAAMTCGCRPSPPCS